MGHVGDSRCCRRWGDQCPRAPVTSPEFRHPPLGRWELPGAFPTLSYFIFTAAPVSSTSRIFTDRDAVAETDEGTAQSHAGGAKPGFEPKPIRLWGTQCSSAKHVTSLHPSCLYSTLVSSQLCVLMVQLVDQGPLGGCGEEAGAVSGQGHPAGFPWPPLSATTYCVTQGGASPLTWSFGSFCFLLRRARIKIMPYPPREGDRESVNNLARCLAHGKSSVNVSCNYFYH